MLNFNQFKINCLCIIENYNYILKTIQCKGKKQKADFIFNNIANTMLDMIS